MTFQRLQPKVVTQLPDTEKRVKTFPAELAFCRPWRKYQARLLERLDEYLADGRLHVVAAPGNTQRCAT